MNPNKLRPIPKYIQKQIKKQAENDMKRYDKYAPLQGFFQNYNL